MQLGSTDLYNMPIFFSGDWADLSSIVAARIEPRAAFCCRDSAYSRAATHERQLQA